jgi:hypothetical protein
VLNAGVAVAIWMIYRGPIVRHSAIVGLKGRWIECRGTVYLLVRRLDALLLFATFSLASVCHLSPGKSAALRLRPFHCLLLRLLICSQSLPCRFAPCSVNRYNAGQG